MTKAFTTADVTRMLAEIKAKGVNNVVPPKAKRASKVITKTEAKLSITNNRVALTVKYTNGQILKMSSTPRGVRMNSEQPASMERGFNLKPLFAMVTTENPKESPADQFTRLQKFFAVTESIQDATAKIPK
jgi:hypothetical protein